MDEGNRRLEIPAWSIALDVVGALLLALGIFGLIHGDTLMPGSGHIRACAVVAIAAGALLMMPMIIIVVRQAMAWQRPR